VLDAAIVLRHDDRRRDGEVILEKGVAWMAAPDFEHRPGDERLRLATQSEPCSVQSMAIAALDGSAILWTEVFGGGDVATISAATSAGLAIAALGRRVAPPGTIDVRPRRGPLELPARDVMLHARLRGAARSRHSALRSGRRPCE